MTPLGNVMGWATRAGRGFGSLRAWAWVGNFPPATNPHSQHGLPKPAAGFFLSMFLSPLLPSLNSLLTASDHVAMLPLWLIQSHALSLCTCTPSLELSLKSLSHSCHTPPMLCGPCGQASFSVAQRSTLLRLFQWRYACCQQVHYVCAPICSLTVDWPLTGWPSSLPPHSAICTRQCLLWQTLPTLFCIWSWGTEAKRSRDGAGY